MIRFFESKADLAVAAIDADWQKRRADLDAIFSPTVPPLDRLKNYCDYGYKLQTDPKCNAPKFQVIACIGGRGFGIRREDMKKLLLATKGKVFTLKTLDRLVDCSNLKEFRAAR